MCHELPRATVIFSNIIMSKITSEIQRYTEYAEYGTTVYSKVLSYGNEDTQRNTLIKHD